MVIQIATGMEWRLAVARACLEGRVPAGRCLVDIHLRLCCRCHPPFSFPPQG